MKGIADLLDSDEDDVVPPLDENSILSSASDAPNVTTSKSSQTKRGKKRQRVTMPPKSKAKAPAKKAAVKQTAGVKRKASDDLDEQDINQDSNENGTETLDNEEREDAPPKKAAKRGRPAVKSKTATKESQKPETEDDLAEVEEPAVEVTSKHAAGSKPASKVASKTAVNMKPKPTQKAPEIDTEPLSEVEQEEVEPDAAPIPRTYARETSIPRHDPPYRRRAGSASDTERGDPNLRRKLGDITRKFDNVDLKYRNLREVGINDANTNMEKMRKQCDETTQASNKLIASLKQELALQAPLAQEARKIKKQMQIQDNELAKMRKEAEENSSNLIAAQNEIKALQAKLAARSLSVEHSKTPASAFKSTSHRSVVTGNAELSKALETAQMKLELYGDLTGLLVLNAKKTEEGITYECGQTGQYGSGMLHFHLFVDQEMAGSTSFEQTEYLYTPLLEMPRDRELVELMPEYLTDEITFARENASKFYGRVVGALTRKRSDE